ncbi:MAG: polysaccharide biosynthesis C-terminal domain-containing protein [Bacteroidetes bacterium]|nr:polysaccharide biosynthesis C-terminal domain-containing protein [Bacteroidota bacterium]
MNFKISLQQGLIWRSLYFLSLLLVNIFFSRYLKASTIGWVFYLTNIFAFVQLLASLSLESGITYFAASGKINANHLFWVSSTWSIVIGFISSFLLYFYLHYFGELDPAAGMKYFYFSFCYITGLLLTNYATVLFYAKGVFKLPNILMVSLNFILLLLILCFFSFYTNALDIVLNIYFLFFLLQGFILILAYLIQNKSWREFGWPNKAETKKILRFSIISLMANTIFFLVYRIDYWFVHKSPVCTDADLGNYIQVSKIGQMLLIVPQIIASVVYPGTASGQGREQFHAGIMIIARLLSRLFLVALIITSFFGNTIFITVFGETFDRMWLPFMILIPGIFALSVLTMLSSYFAGKGNLRVNVIGASIALMIVITGDYFFVPKYGIIAAACVSSMAYMANLAFSLRQFKLDYNINIIHFFTWKKSDFSWLKKFSTKEKFD